MRTVMKVLSVLQWFAGFLVTVVVAILMLFSGSGGGELTGLEPTPVVAWFSAWLLLALCLMASGGYCYLAAVDR